MTHKVMHLWVGGELKTVYLPVKVEPVPVPKVPVPSFEYLLTSMVEHS